MILWNIFYNESLKEKSDVYESNHNFSTNLYFKEVSQDLKVRYEHRYFSNDESSRDNHILTRGDALGGVMPSVAISDFNGDGFVDIFVTSPHPDQEMGIFLNQKGESFKRIDHQDFFETETTLKSVSSVLFVDVDGDGHEDLYLSTWGCHRFFLNRSGKFREAPEYLADVKCHGTNAINFADFNNDGFQDIVLGNYAKDAIFKHAKDNHGFGDKKHGDLNVILWNEKGKKFKAMDISSSKAYTMAIGVSDINKDGYADILFTNDYSTDEFYINNKDKSFIDKTEKLIPRRFHGYAGMSADFADINGDEKLDLYISNIFKKPFYHMRNLLWINKGDSFENKTRDYSVGQCGWSWASKFVDFNLDGIYEIVVVNGRFRGSRSQRRGSSYWYKRISERSLPIFLRKFARKMERGVDLSGYEFSGYERSCLFQKNGEKYYDMAVLSGLVEDWPSRGMSILDYNNDGKKDVLITNFGGPVHLFENQSKIEARWYGVDLRLNNGGVAVGAKILAKFSGGKKQYIELYPANGFNGQSDSRLVLAHGKEKLDSIEVIWPSGKKVRESSLKEGAYTKVRETL